MQTLLSERSTFVHSVFLLFFLSLHIITSSGHSREFIIYLHLDVQLEHYLSARDVR